MEVSLKRLLSAFIAVGKKPVIALIHDAYPEILVLGCSTCFVMFWSWTMMTRNIFYIIYFILQVFLKATNYRTG